MMLVTQSAAATPPRPVEAGTAAQGALSDPAASLGSGWKDSPDVLVTGIGDTNGFHLYTAREKDAFRWSTLATLTSSGADVGSWIGNVCVTGSGRYAVAVYAPAMAANEPALMRGGALAAVVDVRTGKARQVANGVQLAHFNPSCGAGDRALLTRAIGEDMQQTDLLTVDAAAGKVTVTRRIKAQLTTPTAAADGDYGIAHTGLVKIDAAGGLTSMGRPAGSVYGLRATAKYGIDIVSINSAKQAVAERFWNGKFTRLGSGAGDRLQLFGQADGTNALVGDVAGFTGKVPGLSLLDSPVPVEAVSQRGHLQVQKISPRQLAKRATAAFAAPDPDDAGYAEVAVRATRSGRVSTGSVSTTAAPTLDARPELAVGSSGPKALAEDPPKPPNLTTPVCAVPRNDVTRQALQPIPPQIQWAVNHAVHGTLNVQRPANYLRTGQPAYTPQGMFPLPAGWAGKVPSQIMLAILAQETNMEQASRKAAEGDGGNPLISDYYGVRKTKVWDKVDFNGSDCGYGISQVTDGMRLAHNTPQNKLAAISTDYAANIARGLQILIEKWNQVAADGNAVNNNDPRYVENWYLAVWAYNSGYHSKADRNTGDGNGFWGVGWFNNPANPAYPANRDLFLRGGMDDAAHPERWTYPEKILGWVEKPQVIMDGRGLRKYHAPIFGSATDERLTLPGKMKFCSMGTNNCDPAEASNPCPAVNSSCWWTGKVSWADCATECAVEWRSWGPGSVEPEMEPMFPPMCTEFDGSGVGAKTGPPIVVDNLADSSMNVLRCPGRPRGGKFTLRTGAPAGKQGEVAQVDLHQLGAGYLGHHWTTHSYPRDVNEFGDRTFNKKHTVVGTWTPSLPVAKGRYDILVHLPSHGGAERVEYVIKTTAYARTCVINQDTEKDRWVWLGNWELGPKSDVRMNNNVDGSNGTTNVAYDAMAFVPTFTTDGAHACGENYP